MASVFGLRFKPTARFRRVQVLSDNRPSQSRSIRKTRTHPQQPIAGWKAVPRLPKGTTEQVFQKLSPKVIQPESFRESNRKNPNGQAFYGA